MNDFKNGIVTHTFVISKKGEIKADNLPAKIEEVFPDKEDGSAFSLVYIYYYKNKKFKYPCGKSNVLYIGHTVGQRKGSKISASFRFMHLKDGKDYNQNITLSKIYQLGKKIGLDIIEINDCASTEKKYRYEFLNRFGALPIADGAAYSKNKAAVLVESVDTKLEEEKLAD